jgi:hypothetical protein
VAEVGADHGAMDDNAASAEAAAAREEREAKGQRLFVFQIIFGYSRQLFACLLQFLWFIKPSQACGTGAISPVYWILMGLSMLFFVTDYQAIFWFLRHRVFGSRQINIYQWLKTSSNIVFCHLSIIDLYLDMMCVVISARYAQIAKEEQNTELEDTFNLL